MHSQSSTIKPIKDIKSNRPLWSVVIPTYNCANYLKETLESVLKQYPGPEKMEIIVVDDHSTKDNPMKVVEEVGLGRVKFIRQQTNVGKSKNYETGLKASKGIYIHLLHGDDTVSKGFYSKIEELFKQFPAAGAAFCQCNYIDANGKIKQQTGIEIPQDGIIPNWLEKIATWQRIQPPSVVIKREVYENIGGYSEKLQYFEDWEFYVRASLRYDFIFTPQVLANYRVFEASSSQQSILKGERLKAISEVTKIVDDQLPSKVKKTIFKPRKIAYSNYLLLFLPSLLKNFKLFNYCKTFILILKLTPNLRIILRGIKLSLK